MEWEIIHYFREYYEDYNYTGNEEQVYINKTFTRVPELNDPCDY